DMDTAMAALLILQTATDHELASCFIGIPPDKEPGVRSAFAIPDDFDPVGVVTIGHHVPETGAAGSPTRRARKDTSELVHRGRWGHHASSSA
ncbi:MAG: nitroreductase family protein, partial [Nocardioides sp.]